MKKRNWMGHVITIVTLTVFALTGLASTASTPETSQSQQSQQQQTQSQQEPQPVQQQQTQAPSSQYFTGDGGKTMSIAVLAPQAIGLEENQSYLPALVQGEFVSNFSGFSAISVLDRERLDDQYAELFSGYYSDNAEAGRDLGHLTPTTHIMGGNITRTATGYAMQIQITKTSDKMTAASYSGTFTFAELDNLTGIRRASLDLLQKIGVTLTARAQGELSGAAAENHINANTALARGVTAQRQGTEVAALSYFYQAAAFDPSLQEAISRSSILSANISGKNIGDNVRNDIAWRRQWVDRLTETEQYFDSFNKSQSMPYTLFYVSNEIKQGAIDYRNETVTLSVETHLHGSGIWTLSIERVLQEVWDGLNNTGRKDTWGLGSWPRQGVTNLNAFARRNNNFTVVFELLNDQNIVIGRQTLQSGGQWEMNWSDRPTVNVTADDRKTLNFQNVNANNITDKMTIRVASVNGTDAAVAARNGVLQIRANTRNEFVWNDRYRFAKGEIQGFANNESREAQFTIPDVIWGDPVISIGNGSFRNTGLTRITIPNSVTTIGSEAFTGNNLTSINIGENVTMSSNSFGDGFQFFTDNYNHNGKKAGTYNPSTFKFLKGEIQGFANNSARVTELVIPNTIWGIPVTSIGKEAFKNMGIISVVIPNSVTTIGQEAFFKQPSSSNDYTRLARITIGANVAMARDSFRYTYYSPPMYEDSFQEYYERNNRKAGTYTYYESRLILPNSWRYQP